MEGEVDYQYPVDHFASSATNTPFFLDENSLLALDDHSSINSVFQLHMGKNRSGRVALLNSNASNSMGIFTDSVPVSPVCGPTFSFCLNGNNYQFSPYSNPAVVSLCGQSTIHPASPIILPSKSSFSSLQEAHSDASNPLKITFDHSPPSTLSLSSSTTPTSTLTPTSPVQLTGPESPITSYDGTTTGDSTQNDNFHGTTTTTIISSPVTDYYSQNQTNYTKGKGMEVSGTKLKSPLTINTSRLECDESLESLSQDDKDSDVYNGINTIRLIGDSQNIVGARCLHSSSTSPRAPVPATSLVHSEPSTKAPCDASQPSPSSESHVFVMTLPLDDPTALMEDHQFGSTGPHRALILDIDPAFINFTDSNGAVFGSIVDLSTLGNPDTAATAKLDTSVFVDAAEHEMIGHHSHDNQSTTHLNSISSMAELHPPTDVIDVRPAEGIISDYPETLMIPYQVLDGDPSFCSSEFDQVAASAISAATRAAMVTQSQNIYLHEDAFVSFSSDEFNDNVFCAPPSAVMSEFGFSNGQPRDHRDSNYCHSCSAASQLEMESFEGSSHHSLDHATISGSVTSNRPISSTTKRNSHSPSKSTTSRGNNNHQGRNSASSPTKRSGKTNPRMRQAVCSHCGSRSSPAWRRDHNRNLVCNACGIYYRQRNQPRPYALFASNNRN